ncbi:PepSY domain-containing protein [Halomonas denitrificans]|uniref:PepSY-associated TM helix domain-containing protein n=1 Tax=Halomonas TaxID=2745 RepID=UPI001C93F34E|nr:MULTISPECIES: PepSY-associated TM helix domain-containing protein [Halomonas]MBY5929562.1 PepSY domain-containing protein [Halomonas sp. DP8Y7-3]MCA0975535.1 PepSY domain-containing protein [Halomonas denitrificans]
MTTRTTHAGPALKTLVIRLHFYIGLLVGPFIFFAALTGTLYALTPALEQVLYKEALTTSSSSGTSTLLSRQVAAAQDYLGVDTTPSAVRPAPEPGTTTRVMFADPLLGASEHRAIFIDPHSLEVRGDMTVYGTSGVLPLRRIIDQIHRSLMQGDPGRLYSELAASWMWLAALAGLAIWALTPSPKVDPGKQSATARRLRTRRRHSVLGLFLLIGLLALSATGMTWSKHAGDNFFTVLKAAGWGTPRVSQSLDGHALHQADAHADHGMAQAGAAERLADFDIVEATAREAGLDAGKIELLVPGPNQAWKVREIDRSWPSQVDEVAVHPSRFTVLDQVSFSDYPLAAKLTRWGIDGHMGILFGLPNQLLLAALGIGIMTMVAWGYAMWWRRPSASNGQTLWPALLALPLPAMALVIVTGVLLGLALPVMGASLVLFLAVDAVRSLRFARQRANA